MQYYTYDTECAQLFLQSHHFLTKSVCDCIVIN